MEENVKLLGEIKDIGKEEAVVLNYRKLQLHHQKEQLKHSAPKSKNFLAITQPEPS